jgi:heat shock protein 4
MISQDKIDKERSDAKNAVEEYVYDMRGKLDGGEYTKYSDEKTRHRLLNDLRSTENWLYDQGMNQERNIYIERLKSLKVKKNQARFSCLFFDIFHFY